jgi:hypothetical protein
VVPDILVTGGGGALDGLAATLMRSLRPASGNGSSGSATPAPAPAAVEAGES